MLLMLRNVAPAELKTLCSKYRLVKNIMDLARIQYLGGLFELDEILGFAQKEEKLHKMAQHAAQDCWQSTRKPV